MRLYVPRPKRRQGLYLPMGQSPKNPSLLFPLTRKLDPSELDEQIRAQLEKVGITKESEVNEIMDKAEADYELRIKVAEASKEIRRLMALKKEGATLMQNGNKKWKQVFYGK